MPKHNLTHASKVTRVANASAAGTTDIEPANGIDMAGFDSVTFIVAFGTIVSGAATSVKAQQSSAVDGSGDAFSDIEGSSITVADDDDDGLVLLEIAQATKRYVRPVVVKATQNSTVDGIIALQHGARTQPVTHDATTVIGAERHRSKPEGTA